MQAEIPYSELLISFVSKPRVITSLPVLSAHQLENWLKCAKFKTDVTLSLKLFMVNLVAQSVNRRQTQHKLQTVKITEHSQDLYRT